VTRFVPATAELAAAFYGKPSPRTFRGFVCLIDEKPAGIVGIYNDGPHKVVFSDIGEPYQGEKRAIVQGIRLARELMSDNKLPTFAIENADYPSAPALLAKLGFVPMGESEHGRILVRPA
jgi:hypothetical protein